MRDLSELSPLRAEIERACQETGHGLDDLSAMSSQRDPYRRDTKANRREAAWVADQIDQHVRTRTVHPRGLHYILATVAPLKPDGLPYRNTDADWSWMSGKALTAARWLGYVPFDRIVDNRNDAPIIRVPSGFRVAVSAMPDVDLPDAEDFEPQITVEKATWYQDDFHWRAQPYTLVFAGEKASLHDVVAPVARTMNAAIFLPTGEMSDGMIWTIVQTIENAARPAVIFYLADFDPAGFSMPKNVARKLQAMRSLGHLTQSVTVHATALSVDQCIELNLPSTPLKATDRRAAAWTSATGREQTEIDALAALDPDALRQILRADAAPYFDATLPRRVSRAVAEYEAEQTARLRAEVGTDGLAAMRDRFEETLGQIEKEIEALRRASAIDPAVIDGFELPPFDFPEPHLDGLPTTSPLLDPADDWVTQTRKLVDRRRFEI